MESLLRVGLSNAAASVVLALAVMGFSLVWRRPALIHGLWLLVLLKLVSPPLLPIPLAFGRPATPGSSRPEPTPVAIEVEPVALADPVPEPGPMPVLELIPDEPPPPVVTDSGPSWAVVLSTIWLAGSAAAPVLTCIRVRRFNRLMRPASPAPAWVQQRTRDLADRLGLARCPGVWFVPGRVSPMIWGVVRAPRLIVPGRLWGRLDESQRDALLVHELAHLRRRDHWVRALELAATTLYWWHPAAWWARRQLREAEEQCCDAWVVWALPGSARAYAIALVEAVDFLSGPRPDAPALASGMGQFQDLSRRLTMIMRAQTPRSLSWSGRLAVLGLGALLLPILPTSAQPTPRVESIEPPTVEARPVPGPTTPAAVEARPTLEPLPAPTPSAVTDLPSPTPPISATPAPAASENAPGTDSVLGYLKANLRRAQDQRARLEALHKAGALTQATLDQADAAVEAARMKLIDEQRRLEAERAQHEVGEKTARELRAERQTQARDEVEVAEAALAGKLARVQEAKARRERALVVLNRLQNMEKRNPNFVSKDEITKAETDVPICDAQIAVREAEVREAEVRLRQARRALAPFDPAAPPASAANTDQDRRMRDLEAKLDLLLREVQDLRRERQPRANEGGETFPPPPSPTPTLEPNPRQPDAPQPKAG